MALFNPYLHFAGNTEEAFNFYKSILGGEFIKMVRYKDLPQSDEHKIPEAYLDKIMYIALPIGKNNVLMGSDAILESTEKKFTVGDNFHISISAENKEEANNLFNGLSVDGKIEMPIANSPWGSYFGMLIDKFGIQWTVDFDPKDNRKIKQ
ncbi:VOC family protein [Flavobacterium sp. W1B]|uniref:VOC family protein n=1 Tax=Flavobacterium sp. W1B TaxID=3394146 RepID=UPI0039BCCDC7